jgi:hypothetical protein
MPLTSGGVDTAQKKKKSSGFGTYLTARDKERYKKIGPKRRTPFHVVDGEVVAGRNIPAPTLLADEETIGKAKKKRIGAQQRRSGRASTILSETLG